MSATGGTITTDGDYKVHTFLFAQTGTDFTITNLGDTGTVECLVVGGGAGARGLDGGGSGAGGLLYNATLLVSAQAYEITVGDGGAGANDDTHEHGGDSVFSSLTAIGGGIGGQTARTSDPNEQDGGSGGGQSYSGNGGDGIVGQGYDGGGGSVYGAGGGGGGASEAGESGTNPAGGGDGGNGVAYSITGSSVTYAGGGGGGAEIGSAGNGGTGGGGDGSYTNGTNGTDNLGGGGGGGGWGTYTGGDGGNGIVIIRYEFQ